jgi:anti-anti-sigma factor
MDSSALGALVHGYKALRANGGQLVVRSPNERTYELLEITGLHKLLTVSFPSPRA